MNEGTNPADRFSLSRNAFGRLVLTLPRGDVYEGVVPVRAFPIAAPDEGVALVGADGHELAWIGHLADCPARERHLIEEELRQRDFIPQILRLQAVSGFATPSQWSVQTDRGATQFVLMGEEFIRRLGKSGLLIEDSHGIHFLVPDLGRLDRASRRLLDRFL